MNSQIRKEHRRERESRERKMQMRQRRRGQKRHKIQIEKSERYGSSQCG